MACNYLARRSDYVVYHAFGMVLYIFYREAAFKSKCRSFIPSLKRIYLMLMSNFLHLQTCAISALPIYSFSASSFHLHPRFHRRPGNLLSIFTGTLSSPSFQSKEVSSNVLVARISGWEWTKIMSPYTLKIAVDWSICFKWDSTFIKSRAYPVLRIDRIHMTLDNPLIKDNCMFLLAGCSRYGKSANCFGIGPRHLTMVLYKS